jgi:hypothetical protein
MRVLLRVAVVACLLLLVACKTNPFAEDLPTKLFNSMQAYEDTVRWGELRNLYVFARQREGEEIEVPDGLGNVRVTGYEATEPRQIDETRWAVTAVIDYVLTDRQIVRRVVDNQVWSSDDDGDTWLLDSPIPRFP